MNKKGRNRGDLDHLVSITSRLDFEAGLQGPKGGILFATEFEKLGQHEAVDTSQFMHLSIVKDNMLLRDIGLQKGNLKGIQEVLSVYIRSNSQYFSFNEVVGETDAQIIARNVYTIHFINSLINSGISIAILDTLLSESIYFSTIQNNDSISDTIDHIHSIANNPVEFIQNLYRLKGHSLRDDNLLDESIKSLDSDNIIQLKNLFGFLPENKTIPVYPESIRCHASYVLLITHCIRFRNSQSFMLLRELVTLVPTDLVNAVRFMMQNEILSREQFDTLPLDIKTQLTILACEDKEIRYQINAAMDKALGVDIVRQGKLFDKLIGDLSVMFLAIKDLRLYKKVGEDPDLLLSSDNACRLIIGVFSDLIDNQIPINAPIILDGFSERNQAIIFEISKIFNLETPLGDRIAQGIMLTIQNNPAKKRLVQEFIRNAKRKGNDKLATLLSKRARELDWL